LDRVSVERLLVELGEALPGMTLYMLGGGVMVLRELKEDTVDLDFMAESNEDLREARRVLKSIGFREYEAQRFERRRVGDRERVDIDAGGFLGMPLTGEMRSRAELRRFGAADVMLLSDEDVLLFKAVTGRYKDLGDVRALSGTVYWDVVLEESLRMKRMGVAKASPGIVAITLRHAGVDDAVVRRFESAGKQSS